MPLVVFDLDGTLADTTGVDDECFAGALGEVLGLREIALDWSSYPHATDTGLALEITRRHLGRELRASELQAVRACFFARLEVEARDHPERYAPVPGAREVLTALRGPAGSAGAPWGLAIATGAWDRSAAIKIEAARLPASDLPRATSDDAMERPRIILAAIARVLGDGPPEEAQSPAGSAPTVAQAPQVLQRARARFGGVLYVGDGVWDARAARTLGIGFVGVRVRGDFERLRAEGAVELASHYHELAEWQNRLARAAR